MPEIEIGNLKVKMTVDEFVEFLKRTDPNEMAPKLKALAEKSTELTAKPA